MSYIYGYWVSRDEIYEVPYCEHHEKAREIIRELHADEFAESGMTVYEFMFHKDYVRVVNSRYDSDYGVQYRKGGKFSKLQKEYIKDATLIDAEHNPTSYGVMM
jgi:hypothetical protein